MKISVVVPFFNEEKHIESCIAALTGQSYPKDQYEIILVDNNSTDQSATIARRNPEVRVVLEEVQGDYAARNRGIAESTGEIIAFTDADTAPREDWGQLYFSSESTWLTLLAAYDAEKTAFVYSNNVPDLYFAFTCNMAVRRSVFEELGVFPEVMRNADTVFVRRLVDAYSCSAAKYEPTIAVDRLELANLRQYYSKLNTYGRDFAKYSTVAPVRVLSNSERFSVFRKTADNYNCSLGQAVLLFALLAIGGISYDVGRFLGSNRIR
jgi:glycosyltransferase involved in cell wall biosynthesis